MTLDDLDQLDQIAQLTVALRIIDSVAEDWQVEEPTICECCGLASYNDRGRYDIKLKLEGCAERLRTIMSKMVEEE